PRARPGPPLPSPRGSRQPPPKSRMPCARRSRASFLRAPAPWQPPCRFPGSMPQQEPRGLSTQGPLLALSQVIILARKPIDADGAEYVQIYGVFESHSPVRHVRGNMQHLTFAHYDFAPLQLEPERPLQDVSGLFAFVMVLRHHTVLGDKHLRHHGPLSP